MIVLKFGGTSVQDPASMNQALDICLQSLSQAPLMVSSAMSGVTNDLVALTAGMENKEDTLCLQLIDKLQTRHEETLNKLATGNIFAQGLEAVREHFSELRALVKGSLLLGECSPRVKDRIWGMGEILSTQLLFRLCQERGIPSRLVDARQCIVTDAHFGEAAVLWAETQRKIGENVHLEKNLLTITQGFIGATAEGVMTVLGRGGSDYSGALFGAALGAEEIQIWTDVDGIMTTDPRKVKTARSIPEITYAEAAELAFFGAKVVHPATIQPAVEKKIPVLVKNTKNPAHPGTTILPQAEGIGMRAIACRKGVTLLTVTSSRMLNAYGFLKTIFEVFHKHKTPVDLIATSEVSVSMTIDDAHFDQGLVKALEAVGSVKIEGDCSIVCLVGQEVWKDTRFLQKVFSAIPEIPVKLISLGSSEINLSLVISTVNLDSAVEKMHYTFFES